MTRPIRRAFTLMELLVVIIVLAVLASLVVPGYRKSIERGSVRAAEDVLRTAYTGEQVYFSFNKAFFKIDPPGTAAEWRTIFMDDPNTGSTIPVEFSIALSATGFIGVADRGGKVTCLTINENRKFNDAVDLAAVGCTAVWAP